MALDVGYYHCHRTAGIGRNFFYSGTGQGGAPFSYTTIPPMVLKEAQNDRIRAIAATQLRWIRFKDFFIKI